MASSLKAAIQQKFGISAQLVEGHNGIYEMIIDGSVGYSNQSTCATGFPSNEEIFQVIGQYRDPLPMDAIIENASDEEFDAPFCSLSDPVPVNIAQSADCGCGTDAVESASAAAGCGCDSSIELPAVEPATTASSCGCAPSIGLPTVSGNSNNCCG